MSQNTREFASPLEQLELRHPESRARSVRKLADLPADDPNKEWNAIAAFMETAWSASYRPEIGSRKSRFLFTPGYLEWLFSGSSNYQDSILVTLDQNQAAITGLILLVPRHMEWNGRRFKSGIITGLSVDPSQRGHGIGQQLHFAAKEELFCQNDGQPIFMWWDTASHGPGQAMRTFLRHDHQVVVAGRHAMLYKIFDRKEASRVLDLKWYEKLFLATTPGDRRKRESPPGDVVRPMTVDDAEEVFDGLLSRPHPKKTMRQQWSKQQFLNHVGFAPASADDPFRPLNFVYRTSGQTKAALLGYRIPVQQLATGQLMVTDRFITDFSLSGGQRRRFLRNCEALACEQFSVFGNMYFRGFDHWATFFSQGYVSDFPRARKAVMAVSALHDLDRIPSARQIQMDMK